MIKANYLQRTINNHNILTDVSLEIPTSSITILFGPSGSGKTTLCRCLSLLDKPDKGELEILGEKYSFPNHTTIKKLPYPQIGFVYQQLFLWPHLTNKQNILLSFGKQAFKKENLFNELTTLLEIDKIVDRFPNEISLGQKQRVAIARTLILEPEFIFLDEITSALDLVQTKKIGNLLLALKEKGIGILLITHNVEFFKKIATDFIFLQDGKIIESGDISFLNSPVNIKLKNFLS